MSAHNPDNLTPEQVGVAEGWRLLDTDEIISARLTDLVEAWAPLYKVWLRPVIGLFRDATYRTKATKPALRKARGLEPEQPAPQSQLPQRVFRALVLAYAQGHFCDHAPCPGCEAGYALDDATGRQWMQEECEELVKKWNEEPEPRKEGDEPCPSKRSHTTLAGCNAAPESDPSAAAEEVPSKNICEVCGEYNWDCLCAETKIDALQKQLSALSAENEKLRDDLGLLHLDFDARGKALAELSAENERLREEVRDLRATRLLLHAYHVSTDNVVETVNAILGGNRKLQADLARVTAELEAERNTTWVNVELAQQLAAVRRELSDNRQNRLGLTSDLAAERAAHEQTRKERDAHKVTIDAVIESSGWDGVECGLAEFIKHIAIERDEAQQWIDSEPDWKDAYNKNYLALQEQLAAANARAETAERERDEARKHIAEYMNDAQFGTLQAERDSLRARLAATEAEKEKIAKECADAWLNQQRVEAQVAKLREALAEALAMPTCGTCRQTLQRCDCVSLGAFTFDPETGEQREAETAKAKLARLNAALSIAPLDALKEVVEKAWKEGMTSLPNQQRPEILVEACWKDSQTCRRLNPTEGDAK